jgi:hypothetical protein
MWLTWHDSFDFCTLEGCAHLTSQGLFDCIYHGASSSLRISIGAGNPQAWTLNPRADRGWMMDVAHADDVIPLWRGSTPLLLHDVTPLPLDAAHESHDVLIGCLILAWGT